jgi:hypothetical protein
METTSRATLGGCVYRNYAQVFALKPRFWDFYESSARIAFSADGRPRVVVTAKVAERDLADTITSEFLT